MTLFLGVRCDNCGTQGEADKVAGDVRYGKVLPPFSEIDVSTGTGWREKTVRLHACCYRCRRELLSYASKCRKHVVVDSDPQTCVRLRGHEGNCDNVNEDK